MEHQTLDRKFPPLLLYCVLNACCLFTRVWAICPVQDGNRTVLKVATAFCPPFSFGSTEQELKEQAEASRKGITLDLWDFVEDRMNCQSNLTVMSFSDLLESSRNGSIDVGLSCVTVTQSREREMDFSHGYIATYQSILTPKPKGLNMMPIFIQASTIIIIAIAIVLLSAHLFLFIEKKHLDSYRDYPEQLMISVWWSVVTATTVGYGDVYPKTGYGRFLGMIWIATGLVATSFFTATVSSFLTASAINEAKNSVSSLADLNGKGPVGAEVNTTSVGILKTIPLPYKTYPTAVDAFNAVENGEVNSAFYDAPQMDYWRADPRHPDRPKKFDVVGRISPFSLAITFKSKTNLREEVNRHILDWVDRGDRSAAWKKYYGNEALVDSPTPTDEANPKFPIHIIVIACMIAVWCLVFGIYTLLFRKREAKRARSIVAPSAYSETSDGVIRVKAQNGSEQDSEIV